MKTILRLAKNKKTGTIYVPVSIYATVSMDPDCSQACCLFLCHIWQQSNKSSSQNRFADRSLVKRSRARPTTRNDTTFPVDQVSERTQILVIHIHWTWNFTIQTKLARHLLLFQTCAAFTELLQVSTGNRCHVTAYNPSTIQILRAKPPSGRQNSLFTSRPSD